MVGGPFATANDGFSFMFPDVAAFKEQVTQIYALLLKACPSMEVGDISLTVCALSNFASLFFSLHRRSTVDA